MNASLFDGSFYNLPVQHDSTMGKQIDGISTSYLYFGLWFCGSPSLTFTGTAYSIFALHIEDKGLASINYGHFGASKVWYGVAQADYHNMVKLLNRFDIYYDYFLDFNRLFPAEYKSCAMAHAHKAFFLPESVMEDADFNFYKVCQYLI